MEGMGNEWDWGARCQIYTQKINKNITLEQKKELMLNPLVSTKAHNI